MPKLVDRATYSGPAPPSRRSARLSDDQIAAWRALVRAFLGARRAQDVALAGTGLDLSEYDVLFTLAQGPPDGIRPTDLAERVLLTKSGMTRLLARLEQRGLIERRACPTDGRGQLIALSAKGRRLQRRAAPALLRSLRTALAPLSPADLAALKRASERITEAATPHSPV
jgi:DNA-binding MarR family transcriptional regulator